MKKYIFHLKNFIINFSSEFARMKLLNYFETIKLMNYFFQGKKNHRFWYMHTYSSHIYIFVLT